LTTLKDVAEKAKVSVSTASYAINGSKLISEATSNKVLLAARELNYHPNGSAKNLKKNKTEIIGLFLSGFTGPFFNELLEGIQNTVIQNGYEMMVCASNDKHRLLKERHVDGAIILNYHITDELLENLAGERMPMVVLDRELENPYIKKMLLPNKIGMEQVVEHLVDKGHVRIGFIVGSEESFDGEKRLSGFKESLSKRGLSFSENDLIRADFTEVSGMYAMHTYLRENDSYPTAFVSANDEMAMGAIKSIQYRRLSVPEDIAVVGFDDIQLSQYFQPPLTTVNVLKKEWGIRAAKLLLQMLDKESDIEIDEIPIEFKPRQSS